MGFPVTRPPKSACRRSDNAAPTKRQLLTEVWVVALRRGRWRRSPPPPRRGTPQYPSVLLCLLLSLNFCTILLNVQVSCCDDQGRLV